MSRTRHWTTPALLLDVGSSLRSQPGRLTLAMGTMAIGIAVLALMFAVLAGLDRRAARILDTFGADLLAVLPGTPAGQEGGGIPPALHGILRANLPEARVCGVRTFRGVALAGGGSVDLMTAEPGLEAMRRWRVVAGRALDRLDTQQASRVCVVTRALAAERRWVPGDAVALPGVTLTIAGIVDPGADAPEHTARLLPGDRFMVAPAGLPAYWSAALLPPAPDRDALFIQAPSAAAVPRVAAIARRLARGVTGAPTDLAWITPDTLLVGIRKLRRTVTLSAGASAVLCLLLAGATLAGLMLARVQARVAEIGLRRALGAGPRDIAALFVGEALAISAGAAVLGVGVAAGLLAVTPDLPVPAVLTAGGLLLPPLLAAATAVLASLAPALHAARIPPHAALRNE